jgi:phosphoglycerate dehydrogenase-like enzyme
MATVLLLQNPDEVRPEEIKAIREMAPDYDIWLTRDPMKEDPERISEVEISTGFTPPLELILNGRLRWNHAFSAGMDWLFKIENRLELPVLLTNSSGIHAIPISEHIFAMILAHDRTLIKTIRNQSKGIWEGTVPGAPMETIAGKTMLILGLGAIGERVAKLAQAHDMHVLGIRRQPERTCEWVDEMHGPQDMDKLLPRADYVVCILPKTPDSHHIIGQPQIDLMKPGVFIANVGRGMHIDENALIAALQNGKVRGAGLDTFETEPLPADSPFWEMENVIISPHCAGDQPDYCFEARRLFLKNLKRFMAGEPLINVVDKELGYSLTH